MTNNQLTDKLLLIRNQLKMGHRLSFAEAMLLQRAIDILVNKAGNSPVIPDGMLKIGYMFITAEGGTAFSISDVPVPGMTLAGPVYAPAVKAGGQQNAPQNIPEIIPDSCTWTFSSYDDHWSGTCGAEWVFNDGGPEENGVKFCPKCGKSVAISATE